MHLPPLRFQHLRPRSVASSGPRIKKSIAGLRLERNSSPCFRPTEQTTRPAGLLACRARRRRHARDRRVSLEVLGNSDTALFAGFGTFAMLVFTDFGGPLRDRFIAYVGLTGAGCVLIAIATSLSGDAWLAAGAMAIVGFAISFAGALGGSVAAASIAATLAFLLAVTVPADAGEIAARVAGWGPRAVARLRPRKPG
jgi:hypothetical protein